MRAFICCVYLPADDAICPRGHRWNRIKNALYMCINNYVLIALDL